MNRVCTRRDICLQTHFAEPTDFSISVTAEPFLGSMCLLRLVPGAVPDDSVGYAVSFDALAADSVVDIPFAGEVAVPREAATAKLFYELKAGLVDGTRIALVSDVTC
jgi:hypothetical protein